MELRRCSQSNLHFIQAIEGGQVIKVLNVTHGKPKLSFKKLSEIYGIMDFNSQAKPSKLKLKSESENFLFGDSPIQVERMCLPVTESGRIEVKTSHEVFSFPSNDSDTEENNDLGMTLKEIKDKCKTKKRKLSKEINSTTHATFIPSHVKEEIKIVDEHINLLEPLSAWRSKLLKDKKLKKKSIECKVATSSEGVASTVKFEEISTCQDLLLVTGSSTATLDIKSESSEPEISDFLQFHESISSSSSGESRDSTSRNSGWDILLGDSEDPDESSLDLPLRAIRNQGGVNHCSYTCALDDGMLISKAETQSYMVNETHECDDMSPHQQASHLHTVELKIGGHATHPATENTLECENSLSSANDHWVCVFSKECFDHLEQFDLNPVQIVEAKVEEECELPQSSFHPSDKIPIELAEDQGNAHLCYHVFAHNKTLAEDNVFANNNSQENKSQLLAEEENEVQLLKGSAKDGIQGLNVNNGEHPFGYDRTSENASPYTDARNIIYNSVGDCIPIRNSYTVSHQEVSPATEKKQSSNSEYAVENENLSDFNNNLSTDGDENDRYFKLHHPERLLSARKTISPASQKKLCEALQSIELQETERFKCREKLNFGNHTEDQNRTAEGPYKIRRARFTYNRKQPVGKSNKYKRDHLSESVPKDLDVYRASHVNRCTSMQSCSENAITFSQRQMHDIECLAAKLTNELISMKDAVEDILESESSVTSMKHKIDKARIAVKNAKKVEEASKRWLSMMSRDWSRFCKIMRLTENGSLASQNLARKVKKVSFADEAGGKLCDVKLFETDVVSLLD